ncbi:hypothetical protein F5148DRAFT_867800 [Russula earlei]|uniref:Uncharacterized protein n=1 Tax=Russula earlei TaxID=71964 RepID=A0ACC0TS16_9AGAM|nr:hypothetical protein F5148DRAFT_867800 [Russula earlei]
MCLSPAWMFLIGSRAFVNHIIHDMRARATRQRGIVHIEGLHCDSTACLMMCWFDTVIGSWVPLTATSPLLPTENS